MMSAQMDDVLKAKEVATIQGKFILDASADVFDLLHPIPSERSQ